MTTQSLERRLAKVETQANGESESFYLIWAPPGSDLHAPAADAVKTGKCGKQDPAFCFPWPYSDAMPAPRWTTTEKISQAELTAMDDWLLDDFLQRCAEAGRPVCLEGRSSPELAYMTDRELTAAMLSLRIARTSL